MKYFKNVLIVVLVIVMMLSVESVSTGAASVTGREESNPIELKVGKSKNSKFWTGTKSSVYFIIAIAEQGTLNVSFSAEELGTSTTVELRKVGLPNWNQTQKISYNKTKKKTSGTMKSEYILPKGNYIIQVTPGKKITKTKKFNITAKLTPAKCEDVEPNNNEDQAQKLSVYKASSHKMYLSTGNFMEDADLIDCFEVELKDTDTLKISLSSKSDMDGVKVLVREKTDTGYNTIKAYDVVGGKLSESIKLKKGTYYIKVWCADDTVKKQMPYTIKCAC